MKKRFFALLMVLSALLCLSLPAYAVELPVKAKAALLMEKETGQVLFAQNEHEKLEPASVTKVMTLLLVMEAMDRGELKYEDMVTVSANAASMGGSQVYLSEGEQISMEELLKAVCVSSGNDAAVALAEQVAGVTELFVQQMNNRAMELGMGDTHFVNPTGLPAESHVTSAWDIALMSRELILHHPDIRRFTTIWMDTLRDGTFQLAWKIARPNAVISLLAMYEEDQVLPLPSMYGKNLTWKSGGVDACKDAYLVQLISEGKLDPTPLFNKEYTLNEIAQVYEDFAVKRDGLIKPVIKPYEY